MSSGVVLGGQQKLDVDLVETRCYYCGMLGVDQIPFFGGVKVVKTKTCSHKKNCKCDRNKALVPTGVLLYSCLGCYCKANPRTPFDSYT